MNCYFTCQNYQNSLKHKETALALFNLAHPVYQKSFALRHRQNNAVQIHNTIAVTDNTVYLEFTAGFTS